MFWTNNYVSSPHIEALLNKEASDFFPPERFSPSFHWVEKSSLPPFFPLSLLRPLSSSSVSNVACKFAVAGCHAARVDGRGGYSAGMQESE